MSININILPQGTLAIYEQIIMQLKNAIVTGELKSGEALPSIRALAADLQVSVITTKRAYEELEKEGLIRSVAGKGFYVCEYNKDYLKEKQLMMIEKRTQEIIYEAKNAGLSCDDLVDMIRTLYEETRQVPAVQWKNLSAVLPQGRSPSRLRYPVQSPAPVRCCKGILPAAPPQSGNRNGEYCTDIRKCYRERTWI